MLLIGSSKHTLIWCMVRNELEILWEEKGSNLETLQHLFWGTAVCRDVPAEVYGTLCQRLAITGLLVFKGLLHQNMMSPMSPLPTAAIYHKDKIHSGARVCEHTFTCIYHLCKLLPIKRKLDWKLNIKTHKGRRKKRDHSHPQFSKLCFPAGHRGKEVLYAERQVVRKALEALVYLSCF